ncbi:MAG TPA: hypothetical protein VHC90_17020 [Bryobacteraceae bacterium]|nr:hypothetical protein [Bryobacteraceae bacterium]
MNRTFAITAFAAILAAAPILSAGTIAERKENQQDRIAQGVKSGSLNPGETAHIERKESALNKEVHAERTLNNGKLSPAEKKQVNRQQNKLSRQIYRDKHDAK